MPRAKVPPGRRCSSPVSNASSCRGANFNCRAACSRVRPAAWRARASVANAVSLILAALQRLRLARGREAAPQLVRVGELGGALAEVALDAQGEPQRLRGRLDQIGVAREELARLAVPSLPIAQLRG